MVHATQHKFMYFIFELKIGERKNKQQKRKRKRNKEKALKSCEFTNVTIFGQ